MRVFAAGVLSYLVAAAFAVESTTTHRNGWVVQPSTPLDARLTVTFVLRPAVSHNLEATFHAVTDPSNSTGRFRRYLAHEEIAALVAPMPGAAAAVQLWWAAATSEHTSNWQSSNHGELLTLETTPQQLKRALPTATIAHLKHPTLDPQHIGILGSLTPVPVPAALDAHVLSMLGLDDYAAPPRAVRHRTSSGIGCDFKGAIIDPTVITSQYGLPNASAVPGGLSSSWSQAVAAFEDAQFKQSDVDAFDKAYGLPATEIKVVGPNDGGYFGEASLDTQYITAAGTGMRTYFVAQKQFDMLAWCELVGNMSDVPKVLSISWGGPESQYAITRMRAANQCFMKLGLMGVSIFAASGDDGTGKQGGSIFNRCKKFDPTWPASSPYVTSVGATYLTDAKTESGWRSSGGGFSNIFEAPEYQKAAIAGYKSKSGLPDHKLFNASGRVSPDVSALGTCFTVFSGGKATGTLSGTSASTPTFASLVSLINVEANSQGKPSMGFINPVLYKQTSADAIGFDVTDGNNKQSGCSGGFPATVGFDAISGFGTPTFEKLRRVLLDA